MHFQSKEGRNRYSKSDMTHMGNTIDIGPQSGGRTTKEANVRCDAGLDYVGRATGDLEYLLFGWRAAGKHLV